MYKLSLLTMKYFIILLMHSPNIKTVTNSKNILLAMVVVSVVNCKWMMDYNAAQQL